MANLLTVEEMLEGELLEGALKGISSNRERG